MNRSLFNLLLSWGILALGVALAARLVPGISYANGSALLFAVLLLSFCNAVLRPLLLFFTLPFIIVSMGLGIFVVNALLFYFVGNLIGGFHVATFWSALGGSLIVSATSMIMNHMLKASRRARTLQHRPPPPRHDDAIDI